jgi:hypothetical protein
MTIIKIDNSVKASEIKDKFHDAFPFLKIEFFRKVHKNLQGSFKKDLIKDDFNIKIKINDKNVELIFDEEMLVSELEKEFNDKLQLSAQVFRKAGRSWLETTFTDSWSLRKQNLEGMELSKL